MGPGPRRVFVVGDRRPRRFGSGQLGEAVERVVGEGGGEAVGILGRGQVAGRVVGVGGSVGAGQAGIDHRGETVLGVVGVGRFDAVRIGGDDGFHFARRVISVAQRAFIIWNTETDG